MGNFSDKLKEAYRNSEKKQKEKMAEIESRELDLVKKYKYDMTKSIKDRLVEFAERGIKSVILYLSGLDSMFSIIFSGGQSIKSIECLGKPNTILRGPEEIQDYIRNITDFKVREKALGRIYNHLTDHISDDLRSEGIIVTHKDAPLCPFGYGLEIQLIEDDNKQTDTRAD